MRTRSSSNLPVESPPNPSTSNPKRRNRRRSKKPFIIKESPIDTMAGQHAMVELLCAPTEGYAEAIVVPSILAEQFKLKHSLINTMTSNQFFRLEKDNPHDHIRWGSPSVARKRTPAYRDLLHACPHHSFTELHQLDTFYNALNPTDQYSLNLDAGGNLLERRTQDVFTIIENKSKVSSSRNKLVVSQVKSSDVNSNSSSDIAKLTHAVNQQTSAVTIAMTAILKQFQATPPLSSVKGVEEICVTCSGAQSYYQCLGADGNTFPKLRDNIQGYVSAAVINYNQGNSGYRPPEQSYQALTQQNQVVPLSELEKVKRMNEAKMKAMQNQINNVKNELRNEMKNLIQASMSNQTNELKNMMASFFQMNTASTSRSGSLPSNTISNPKGEIKAITTRSGIVFYGSSIPIPPSFINPEEDERVEETLMDQDLIEYPIKKMLKALLSNKEKLLKLANTPLNENCSAVILKKLPKKLGDPGKFLIPCGFSELKCKALANLGASINLMPLSVWKKLGLPELISTRMTLELANRAICTPAGITRDVFVLVGKFTFPADFIIVDYESDPRVPLILGGPFLQTARALIDVHREEMILHDESINMINICNNSSEDFLEKLFTTNHQSGNPPFSSHPKLTSSEVKDDVFDPDHMLKPLFPSPIPIEDNDSFLEKSNTSLSYSDISLPEFETFIIHTEETNSGSATTHVDYSLPKYDSFLFEIEPDQGKLTSTFYFDIEEKNSGSTTIHADISLPDLEFDFKPDPCELTSESGIHENVPSAINVNLPPEEDNSPLFAYVCIRTRSSSNLPGESSPNPTSSNPKRRNRRRSKQSFILEESSVDTMADQHTMSELLRAPTKGYAEAIMVPLILAEQFELKHSLINMMTSDQLFGLEKDNPHDHIRWFNKITSTIKYKDMPNSLIKLMIFPFSLAGAARRWLEKEPSRSILTWEDLVSKFINEFFPPLKNDKSP
nr:reverse transcriptase domain-containing protein [Tanacetum cinerariifolium]